MKTKIVIFTLLGVGVLSIGFWLIKSKRSSSVSTNRPAIVSPESKTGQVFTLPIVSQHNSVQTCYVVIADKVYDLTAWVSKHPGGPQAIVKICGTDATSVFSSQHGGQQNPEKALSEFFIGPFAL